MIREGIAMNASAKALDDVVGGILRAPKSRVDAVGTKRRVYEYWCRAQEGGSKTIKAIVVDGCEPPPRMQTPLAWHQVKEDSDLVKDTSYDHSHGIESWTRAKIDQKGKKLAELDFLTTAELRT
jgi:hypothetical protein